MDVEHRDIQDAPIKVGDIVCYAAVWGRSATLKYGRVTALESRQERSWDNESKVLPTLRVVTADRDYSNRWELQNHGRPITLTFLDRLLVVPDAMVAMGALDLLRGGQ